MVPKFPYLVEAEVCCLSTEKASQFWGRFDKNGFTSVYYTDVNPFLYLVVYSYSYYTIITRSKKLCVCTADEVC